MLKKILTLAAFVLCIPHTAIRAQAIDNTLSYKNMNSTSYLRLNYENDYFAATDRYYTWGMDVEVVTPWIKNFPLSKLLVHPKYSYIRYGLEVEQDAYTPIKEDTTAVIVNDRPFAATLFLKTFLIAMDPNKKQRFSTTLSTGIMGPAAAGMAIQTSIHEVLPHNSVPLGWPNQVHNDVVLNYQVDYEKQIVAIKHILSVDVIGSARAGTLSDKSSLGTTVMAGLFDSPYSSELVTKRNFRLYAYDHPEISIVGYDATMEGGVFNRTSPYVLKPSQVDLFTFQNRLGFVCVVNRLSLEYFRTFMTSEFHEGMHHQWGGIQVAFTL